MFMIVLLHSGSHGRALFISEGLNFYSVWFHFIEALSICSVDVFVLISGYFLCRQTFKPSRVLKLVLVVVFYSVAWLFVTKFVFNDSVSKTDIIKAFFPISYNQYWFISSYVGMYLLSPIINVLIKNLTQVQHLGAILLLVGIFCIWPDVLPFSSPFGISKKGYSVVWFVVLYIIAAYFRNFPVIMKLRQIFKYYIIAACLLLLSWIVIVLVTRTNNFENELQGQMTFYYYRYNSFVVLITAVCLFITFSKIKVENVHVQKLISYVAPLCMGIYLIHDNESARGFIWQGLIELEPTPAAPFIVAGYVILVFVVCMMIEVIRTIIFHLVDKREWYKIQMEKIDSVPAIIKNKLVIQILNK